MRLLKTVFIVALVLVVSDAVWAVTVPPPGVSQFTFIRSRNEDNGTAYASADGLPTGFVDPNSAGILKRPVRDAIGHEDTYGIFLMYRLGQGQVSEPPTGDGIAITPQGGVGGIYYDNSAGTQGTWLVGVFYGGVDQLVSILPTGSGKASSFDVLNRGLQFDLYAVDPTKLAGPLDPDNLEPYLTANRLADNQYQGWVDPNTVGAGSGAVFLMHGTSQYLEFIGSDSLTGKFDGTTNVYFDVDPNFVNPLTGTTGAWADPNTGLSNSNHFPTPKIFAGDPDPNSNLSDVFLTFTDQASPVGWDTLSSDQGGWENSVPEPLTMLGVFLGVGGLGRYLRRRLA